MANDQNGGFKLPRLTTVQLINLCIGIIGIQFAWSMQIALSSRVLEPLGADPFLFGLIWCAGPITGLLVQPIVGAISDRTWTKLGRRRPFLLVGAFLGGFALLFFPFAPTLLIAALMIWVIDACVNISQGPYRALVPDIAPPEQHAVANSYLNFAFGAGSVIALGVAPLLNMMNIEMSVTQQYIMAAIALIMFICYTSFNIKEYAKSAELQETKKKESIWVSYKKFLKCSPEIHKICGVQFLTWMGIMCMFIYLTQYTVHYVYKLPDMSTDKYKVTKENYKTLQNSIDKVDTNNLVVDKANKKLNELLVTIDDDQINFSNTNDLIKSNDKAALDKKILLEPVEHDIQKYQLLNDTVDEILLGMVKGKNTYKNSIIPDLEQLVKQSKDLKNAQSAENKLGNVLGSAYKKLLQSKLLAEYKILLVQYNLLKDPSILPETELLTKSPEKTKALKELEEQRESALKIFKKNQISKERNNGKERFEYDVKSVKTYPEVLITFYKQDQLNIYHAMELDATTTTQWGLVAFNFIPLLLSIPIGYMCAKTGKKLLYSITLGFIAVAFAFAPFIHSSTGVIIMMACAGVAWATILSIPFAFLCDYMPEGEEGSIMGIFNMFIAGPQLISATIVGYVIRSTPIETALGTTHNWSIAFIVASVSVICAIIALQFVNETNKGISCTTAGGGGH